MILNLDEEQTLIDSSIAEVLKNEYSFQQRTYSLESSQGVNPALWNQFAELGSEEQIKTKLNRLGRTF